MLAVILTWPLSAHLSTYYSDASDHAYGGWTMWHIAEALKNGSLFNMQQFFTSNQFYPFSNSFAYSDHMFFPGLVLFTPLYILTNHIILSFNLVIVLSFVLTYISSFVTIRYFVKNTYASLIGALIFTYNPLVFASFPHHADLLQRYFLPLVFLWGYRYIRSPSWRSAIIFYGVLTLNWLTAVYYGVFTLIFIPIFCAPILFSKFKEGLPYIHKLLITSIVVIIYIPFIYFITKPYLSFSHKESITRSIIETIHFSARGIDWVSPDPRNMLYVQDHTHVNDNRFPKDIVGFNYSEHTLFLNIVPSLLLIFGLLYVIKIKKGALSKNAAIGFGAVFIVSALLTFGPVYTGWNDPPNTVPHPLLYYYMYDLLFPLRALRVPTRFQHIFYIPFSLVCAYGMLFIKKNINRHWLYSFATAILMSVIVAENIVQITFTEQSQRIAQIQTYLRENPRTFQKLYDIPTLHLPMYTKDVQWKELGYVNWALYTHEKTVNGYSAFTPIEYQNILEKSKTINDTFIRYLGSIGVQYVIVHLDSLTEKLQKKILDNTYAKTLTVYKDEKTLILSTSKESSIPPLCVKPNVSISINFPNAVPQLTLLPYTLTITNKERCVIQSLYDKRYLTSHIQVGDTKISTDIIVPLVIEPYSSATISGTLKQESSYVHISPGEHIGTAFFPRFNKSINFAILAH
ncbi:MAG: hypothetical protein NUV65_04450 [Candidatus Roizmanbacteria bacterium]|nr:hypothetical protein [Candidatus Roizmanbacteria bacterium]